VAERPLGVVLAPGKFGPSEHSAEEAHIERVKDFFKVIEAASGL